MIGLRGPVIRKNVRTFLNILDFLVSGVKQCQKIDPCVKISENPMMYCTDVFTKIFGKTRNFKIPKNVLSF